MELVYGYTQDYEDGVRDLTTLERRAIVKAVNGLGKAILADQESPPATLVQPARLILKHQYTPTLGILPVSEETHVLLCYDYDCMNNEILVSLLAVTKSHESKPQFFMLAKAIYGTLLLSVE
jgi:hypothetical protein